MSKADRGAGGEEAVQAAGAVSRREILAGGGLLLGALMLTGCQGKRPATLVQGGLPDPYWQGTPDPMIDWSKTPPPAYVPPQPQPNVPRQPTNVPEVGPIQGVVPRSRWARTGVARRGDIYAMGAVRRITIHHDGMPPTSLSSAGDVAARIEQIRQSHVAGRGWADIGYHYVIDPSGRVWEGRNVVYQGAHVKDNNENNLGILVLGNFDRQTPSAAALSSLDRFVAAQMGRYGVPINRVRTHQEINPTECPGRALQSYMVRTRSGGGQLMAMAMRVGLTRG